MRIKSAGVLPGTPSVTSSPMFLFVANGLDLGDRATELRVRVANQRQNHSKPLPLGDSVDRNQTRSTATKTTCDWDVTCVIQAKALYIKMAAIHGRYRT